MNDAFARAPHLRSPAVDQSPHAALLIDFDNVTMGIRSNLGQELRNLLDSDVIRGKVSVQRAYADWRRYPQYIVPLSEASIDLIFAPAYGSSKKNATDIRLAIDALEIVFTRPEIGTFILLSGDSDFSSLVLKLKEYGKYIIGVGMQESSSELLVQNCDEYYSYNSLSGLTAASEATTESFDPWVLAAKTIQRMIDRGDVMRSDRFKQVMLEFDPSFSEKSLGFSKFNRFLAEAASRGIVDLEKAANGQYEVSKGSHTGEFMHGGNAGSKSSGGSDRGSRSSRSSSSSSSRGRSGGGGSRSRDSSRGDGSSRRSSSRGRREAPPSDQPTPEVDEDRLRAAYRLLQQVVDELTGVGEPVRDSEIKRQMLKRDSKFDEGALGFRKFSRFLRQAHDEEIINLEQGPEGNYLVSPLNGASAGSGRTQARRETSRGEKSSRREDASRETREETSGGESPMEDRDEAGEPEAPSGKTVESPPEKTAEPEPERRSVGRGLGRFRRGSKSRSSGAAKPSSGEAIVPGPVDEPGDDAGEAEAPKPDLGTPSKEDVHASRSVTGRGSSRGRSHGPSDAPKAAAGSGTAGSSGSGDDAADAFKQEIEAMSRAYPGVGRRTAERLYEEFGEDVLEVIDNDPDRISNVLPEHRARAVIEGREAQREEGS
ncbi:MAG: NYN domain-containing protein [Gemmatimonadales bacterium]|jgi:uncharacterized protein (TIGR00288 family)